MSALPQPQFPIKPASRRSSSPRRQKSLNRSQAKISNRPKPIAIERKLPVRLQLLMVLQKGSFGFALISIAGSMALYLATVRIPQLWSQEYQNLETLQRQERQLTEINETLKYQMARQAEHEASELSSLKPDDAVFVTPAAVKQQPVTSDRQEREKIAFKYATPGY